MSRRKSGLPVRERIACALVLLVLLFGLAVILLGVGRRSGVHKSVSSAHSTTRGYP